MSLPRGPVLQIRIGPFVFKIGSATVFTSLITDERTTREHNANANQLDVPGAGVKTNTLKGRKPALGLFDVSPVQL